MAAAHTPDRDKRRSRDSMVLDPSPVVQRSYLSKDDSDASLARSPFKGAATTPRNKTNRLSLPAPYKHRRDDVYVLPESPVMKAPVPNLPNARQHRLQDAREPQSLRARMASPERLTDDEISPSKRDSIKLVKSPTVKHPVFLAQSEDCSGIPTKIETTGRDFIIVDPKPLVLHSPPKHHVPSGAPRPDRLDGVGSSQGEDKAILPPSPVIKQSPPTASYGSVSASRKRDSLTGPTAITLQKPNERQDILSPEENTMVIQSSPTTIKLSPFPSSQERPFQTTGEETPKVKIHLTKQPTEQTPAELNSVVLPSTPIVRAPAFPAGEEQKTATVSVGGNKEPSTESDERQGSTGALLETDIDAVLGLIERPRWNQADNNMNAEDESLMSVDSVPTAESEIIPQYRMEAGSQPEHQTLFFQLKPERLPRAERENIKQEDLIINGSDDGKSSGISPSSDIEPESGFFSLKDGQESQTEAAEYKEMTEVNVPSISQQEEKVTEADVPSISQQEEVSEADVPSISQQEENVTEAEVPSMSQEEEVSEADVPSMSQHEEVSEADIPNISQEEEVTGADAANMSQNEGGTSGSEPDSDDYEVVEVRATDIYTPSKNFTEELIIRRRQSRNGKTQWSYKVNRRSWGGSQSDTSPSVPDVTAPTDSWPNSDGTDGTFMASPVPPGQQQSSDSTLQQANNSLSPQTNDPKHCPLPNGGQSELPKDLSPVSPAEKSLVTQRETSAVLRSAPEFSNDTKPLGDKSSPLKDKLTIIGTPKAKKTFLKKDRRYSPTVSPPSSYSRPAIETSSRVAAPPRSEIGHNKKQSDLKDEELPETIKNNCLPTQEKLLSSPVRASYILLPSSPAERSHTVTGKSTNEKHNTESAVNATNGTPDTSALHAEATQSVSLKGSSSVSARTGSFFSLTDDPSAAAKLQGRSSTVKAPLSASRSASSPVEISRKMVRPSKREEERQLPQTKVKTPTLISPLSPTGVKSQSPPRPHEERSVEAREVSEDLKSPATSTNPESKSIALQAGADGAVNHRPQTVPETLPPAGTEALPAAGMETPVHHRPLTGTETLTPSGRETLTRGKHFPPPTNGSLKQYRLSVSENSTEPSRNGVPSATLMQDNCWPDATSSKKDQSSFSNTNFVEDDAGRRQQLELSTPATKTSFTETEATERVTTAEAVYNSTVTVSETEMRTFWRLVWTPVQNASGYMHQQINRALRGPDRGRWWLFLLAVLLVPVALEYRSRHPPPDPAP